MHWIWGMFIVKSIYSTTSGLFVRQTWYYITICDGSSTTKKFGFDGGGGGGTTVLLIT